MSTTDTKKQATCWRCGQRFDSEEQERRGKENDGCCDECSPYSDDYEPAGEVHP